MTCMITCIYMYDKYIKCEIYNITNAYPVFIYGGIYYALVYVNIHLYIVTYII